MKRIKKVRFLLSKNKPLKRALTLVGLVVLLAGGVFATVKMLEEKERVSAHPTNPITIRDENGQNPFDVPIDALRLEEEVLRVDMAPRFDDYVQSETAVPNTTKENVTAYGSNAVGDRAVYWQINDIKRTIAGNYVVLYGAQGNTRGGVIKVSVFNVQGNEIGTRVLGTLGNSVLRVSTGFYESEGNSFLIGTTGDSFFKCTLENESNTSVTINFDQLSTVEISRQKLKTHELFKVGTDMRSNNKPIVTGPVYPSNQAREGIIKGRIPLGALDNQNWQSGNMTADVSHYCSLQSLTMEELGYSTGGTETIIPNLYMNGDGIIYGRISYNNSNQTQSCTTVQIFSQDDVIVDGNSLKRRMYTYINDSTYGNKTTILDHISTSEYIYFLANNETETRLMQVNLTTFEEKEVRTFPFNTRLLITTNDNGDLTYYGSTTSLTGEFYSRYYTSELDSPYYYISGVMEGFSSSDANTWARVKSLRAMEINNWLEPSHVVKTVTNEFLIGGQMQDYREFPDNSYIVNEDGSAVVGTPRYAGAFIGLIKVQDDNSPAISAGKKPLEPIDVDVTDIAIGNPSDTFENPGDTDPYLGWNTMDRWLITGTKNGLIDDDLSVKVYDHYDMSDPLLGATEAAREEWLQRRISRNPLSTSAKIMWESLGFDKTKSGPQRVTYFVADSQGQTSTTSRWVNKETNQTVKKGDYFLDAQNFHVPLEGLDSAFPDDATFKRMAKTMAWNKKSSDLEEDGTDASKLSSKVTVDATQLQALRDATVAKPYPVDVTYTPVTGTSLKNRVWVFVTTENTVPNALTDTPDNGVIFYGNDYSLPFRMRSTHTNSEAVKRADAKVYDYFDSTHEDVDVLPTLADTNKNPEKIVVDLPTIQNATEPNTVRPTFKYKWEGETDANHTKNAESTGYVDVELTGNALLHVRQVVLNDDGDTVADEIVVPTEGYFELRNILFDSANPMNEPTLTPQGNFVGKSGDDISRNEFTSVVVPTSQLPELGDQIQLTVVVPEFYQYLGHYFTFESQDPNGASHLTNRNYIDLPLDLFKGVLNEEGEVWVTMYIKPNTDRNSGDTKTPQPYSWDYEKNKLGKIKIP